MKLSRLLSSLLLAAVVVSLSACPENKAPDSSTGTTASESASSANIDEASDGAAVESSAIEGESNASEGAASAATTSSAGSLPAECEAYIQTVTACVNKLATHNKAMAETTQQSLDQAREMWKQSDVTGLKESCAELNKLFEPSAKAMGC